MAKSRKTQYSLKLVDLKRAERLRVSDAELLTEIVETQHQVLTEDLDAKQVMDLVVRRTQQLTAADGAVVEVLQGGESIYHCGCGCALPHIGMRSKVAGSLTERCVNNGETLYSEDTATDPLADNATYRLLGAKSMIIAPLFYHRKIVGTLKVISAIPRGFAERDIQTVNLMSGCIAAALGRASESEQQIAETKRAEDALRTSEKLAGMGRLTATVAHEIKNPLEAIGGVLHLLEHDSSLQTKAREYVKMAQRELAQAANVVKQTLGFSRESSAPIRVRICEVMDHVIGLYSHKIQFKQIKLEKRYESDSIAEGFPGELRQIFSNLLINALESVPRDSGRLMLHISNARNWKTMAPGTRIVVADNGSGILPENRKKIFQPFFTTKEDKGTGLGLWVSSGLLRKQGGSIRVHSSVLPGHSGTSFAVFLPAAGVPNPPAAV